MEKAMQKHEQKAIQTFVAIGKDLKLYPWACIYCESQTQKQDLQAVDSRSQNSSSTTD